MAVYLPPLQSNGAPPDGRPTRVLLLCSGLDHAKRGFESFARDCFSELSRDAAIDIELVKGSGQAADRERAVWTLTRDARLLKALGRVSGREPFRFEQVAFALTVQPVLRRHGPDVVYFSEWHTGLALAALARITGRRHPMVLSNGTMAVEGFDHLARVQELTPAALATVLERGGDPRRHVMLPLGFPIDPEFDPPTADERRSLRDRLGLPADREVLFSSAALNRHHKRLDYLIEDVARLPEQSRPYVVMAGQPEAETPGIRKLAGELLGADGQSIRTVPHSEVLDLLRASDRFVLASLGEGLPRALLEALGAGLPCLVHDYGVTRFALGEHGEFADFSRPGGLAGLLGEPRGEALDGDRARARHRYAYENFSWDRLRPRYVELLSDAARAPSTMSRVLPTTRAGAPAATE
jgi:glycosyltransferase involved in cell wall biosynthesis